MLGALRFASCIAFTIFWASLGIVTWPLSPSGALYLWYARVWSRMVLGVSGVDLDGFFPEFDPKKPVIFMSNHVSTFDIQALFATIPGPVRMLAKRELSRVPILGWSMWMAGFIFIDRSKRSDAISSLAKAGAAVRAGKSLVIFPEGTRGDGRALLPFKRGGFHLALEAGVPVVPVAIAGTEKVLPSRVLRPKPGRVAVRFGDPIFVDKDALGARETLMQRTRDAIERLAREARTAAEISPSHATPLPNPAIR
jgi:1-acyl-sn-glycerol-3-phosphate acyltransferase